MGSGSLTFASEPLLFIPSGMQVFGSKPWFCMKKMTRLGVALLGGSRANVGRKKRGTKCGADAGCHSLKHVSAIDHDLFSFSVSLFSPTHPGLSGRVERQGGSKQNISILTEIVHRCLKQRKYCRLQVIYLRNSGKPTKTATSSDSFEVALFS